MNVASGLCRYKIGDKIGVAYYDEVWQSYIDAKTEDFVGESAIIEDENGNPVQKDH